MVISFIGNTAAVPVAIDGTVAASRASAEWIDPGLTPDEHPTAFFEASDRCGVFQEVHTYGHLALLARQMRSFRYVSFRRALPWPAGDVVTFSRLPVASTVFHRFSRH